MTKRALITGITGQDGCQRRSKNLPKGGAKVDHLWVERDGAQSAGGQSSALLK